MRSRVGANAQRSEAESRVHADSATPGTEVPEGIDPTTDAAEPANPALFLVKGDATPEEVAALTVVLQGVASASAPADEPEVRSVWASPQRQVRTSYPSGPGGWRASALPR